MNSLEVISVACDVKCSIAVKDGKYIAYPWGIEFDPTRPAHDYVKEFGLDGMVALMNEYSSIIHKKAVETMQSKEQAGSAYGVAQAVKDSTKPKTKKKIARKERKRKQQPKAIAVRVSDPKQKDEIRMVPDEDTFIVRNSARCLICGDEIESKTLHDFKVCSCGNIHIDGGHYYCKAGAKDPSKFESTTVTRELEEGETVRDAIKKLRG